MKKCCAILLIVSILLCGCRLTETQPQLNATYLDLFDTVTTIVGSGMTQREFQAEAQKIYDQLQTYHRLFDIYNEYSGIQNLKTVNDHAGAGPVVVDRAIIDLLLDCKAYYELTGGKVNAAMGSVLRLWHEARSAGLEDPENAKLPDLEALSQAMMHMDFENVLIDEEASTVYLPDPEMSLDVGAIAKGWAAQRVAENAPSGLLISVGGNVCATGAKADGSAWVVGVQNPDGGDYLKKLPITGGAVVTSGDYQRTFTVDGKNYHHIIDPNTGMPSQYWRSVTVICADSGLADALSTALFIMTREDGEVLAKQCNAQAVWVDKEGQQFSTKNFE